MTDITERLLSSDFDLEESIRDAVAEIKDLRDAALWLYKYRRLYEMPRDVAETLRQLLEKS